MNIKVETRTPGWEHNVTLYQIRGADMKLDLDLLRDLLIYVETNATRPESELEDIKLEGWTDEQIAYHVILAEEDGLIKAIVDKIPDTENPIILHTTYVVQRLTSRGHELLGVIQEPKHWRLIKQGASKAGIATVGALFEMGKSYLRAQFGLPG